MTITAREILSAIHVNADADTQIVSFQDAYGDDNAIQLDGRIAVLAADDELDDDGQQWFTWTGYDADGEIIWDTQAGDAAEARASIAAWLGL